MVAIQRPGIISGAIAILEQAARVFIYREGAVTVGNVYGTWLELDDAWVAYQVSSSAAPNAPGLIVFDSSVVGPMTIPTGDWSDYSFATWIAAPFGIAAGAFGLDFLDLTIADVTTFQGWPQRCYGIGFQIANTTGSPVITLASSFYVFYFEHCLILMLGAGDLFRRVGFASCRVRALLSQITIAQSFGGGAGMLMIGAGSRMDWDLFDTSAFMSNDVLQGTSPAEVGLVDTCIGTFAQTAYGGALTEKDAGGNARDFSGGIDGAVGLVTGNLGREFTPVSSVLGILLPSGKVSIPRSIIIWVSANTMAAPVLVQVVINGIPLVTADTTIPAATAGPVFTRFDGAFELAPIFNIDILLSCTGGGVGNSIMVAVALVTS